MRRTSRSDAPPSTRRKAGKSTPPRGASGKAKRPVKAKHKVPRGDAYALRSRILAKAADVFGRLGAADTTVEDILKAAGVSRRTFYRFFQGKDDVLDVLHEIGCNMLIGAATQAAAMPGDPLARLSRAIEAYLEYHVTVGPNVMYVVQGESMRAGSKLGPRRRAFFGTMVEIFQREMHKAYGLHLDPLFLRGLLIAIEGVSLMLRAEFENGDFDLDRAKRVMLRMVMATIAAQEGGGVPPIPVVAPPPTRTH